LIKSKANIRINKIRTKKYLYLNIPMTVL